MCGSGKARQLFSCKFHCALDSLFFTVFGSTALLEVFTFVILLSNLSIGGLSFNICLSNWVLEVLVFDNETV